MTRYELYEKCWDIAWNSKTEKAKVLIEEKIGWKEAFYTTLTSWIASYLAGKKWCTSEIVDEKNKIVPYSNIASTLHDILMMETDISLTKSICEEILLEVRNFKMED